MKRLTMEDVAYLADGAEELPRDTVERVRAWIRSDRRFVKPLVKLERLATAAGLEADLEQRLVMAVELRRDLDRLLEAGPTWHDPAEILDPQGEEGLDRGTLEALSSLAAARPADADDPAGLEAVRARLEAALAAQRADADLVASFVNGLEKRGPRHAQRLLRVAGRLLQEAMEHSLENGRDSFQSAGRTR